MSSVGTVANAELSVVGARYLQEESEDSRGSDFSWMHFVSETRATWLLEILIEWTGVGLRILSAGLDQMPYQP